MTADAHAEVAVAVVVAVDRMTPAARLLRISDRPSLVLARPLAGMHATVA